MLIFIAIIFIIVIIVGFLNIYLPKNSNNTIKNKTNDEDIYPKKYHIYSLKEQFITDYERYFYNIFKEIAQENNWIVHPQLNLASIIYKPKSALQKSKYNTDLFKNIDFAFFTKDYETLLLLIEINDKTHLQRKRQKRDQNVKNICKKVGIQLIHFYSTSSNNTKEHIKEVVLKVINENQH